MIKEEEEEAEHPKKINSSYQSPIQKAKLKDTVFDLTNNYFDNKNAAQKRGSSVRQKKEELNVLVEQSLKDLQKTGRNSEGKSVQRNTQDKEGTQQLPDLLSKFKSEKELRDALQNELDETRKEVDTLKLIHQQLNEEIKDLKSRLSNFQASPRKVSVDGRLQAQCDRLQRELNDEMDLSRILQQQIDSLNELFDNEKKRSADYKRSLDQLKAQIERTKNKPNQKQKELQDQLDKTKKQLITVETQLSSLQNQLQIAEKSQKVEKQQQKQLSTMKQPEKALSQRSSPGVKNKTIQALQHRIVELEAQLKDANNLTPEDDTVSLEAINKVIGEFQDKEQEINHIFGVLEKECMTLIQVIREKERLQHQLRDKISQIDQQFSAACGSSPMQINSRIQRSDPDTQSPNKSQDQQSEMKRSLTRMQPSTNLDMVEINDEPLHTRQPLQYIEQLELIKQEYTNRLKEMSQQILRLNEIIYSSSTKQIDSEQNKQRQAYLQKANRQLEHAIKNCRQQHESTIERLIINKKILQDQVKTLTEDLASSQNQIANIMQEMNNLRANSQFSSADPSEIEQQLRLQNIQYQRMNTDMAIQMDGFRRFQTRMQEMMAQKDAQLEDLKQRSRTNLNHVTVQDVQQYTQSLIESLVGAAATANNQREVQQILKRLMSNNSLQDGHIQLNRLDRVWIQDRIRQISVEFQKLKINRLKALDGNSQLRKDFIKSVLPVQARLDQLLLFNQGILNSKHSDNISQPKRLRVSRES